LCSLLILRLKLERYNNLVLLINKIDIIKSNKKLKTVSWNATSNEALDNTTPVIPPIVNSAKNPNTNTNGVLNLRLPPYKVANQENILIPVGTAITIVAAVK